MATQFHIQITNGVFKVDSDKAPRIANDFHAPNAKQYFAKRGLKKPAAVSVRGWSFEKIYITHGTEENGQAVAWA